MFSVLGFVVASVPETYSPLISFLYLIMSFSNKLDIDISTKWQNYARERQQNHYRADFEPHHIQYLKLK
jgi:hypothetical protein